MTEPLITMLEIYKPLEIGKDWMNYKINRPRDLTFHHILEARNGGKRIITNGAILVKKSHMFLNYLDNNIHSAYMDLNYLFFLLNCTEAPPTEEYYREVNKILRRVR